jgi:hypothetical protein
MALILSDKHLYGGAKDIFWIKLIKGTFIALQMKSFITKKFKLHAGVEMCYFANFFRKGQDGNVLFLWPTIISFSFSFGFFELLL